MWQGSSSAPALKLTANASVASAAHRQRIENLFAAAAKDRSQAFELKQELDRLGVFKDYEDRFLDLFQKPESE